MQISTNANATVTACSEVTISTTNCGRQHMKGICVFINSVCIGANNYNTSKYYADQTISMSNKDVYHNLESLNSKADITTIEVDRCIFIK